MRVAEEMGKQVIRRQRPKQGRRDHKERSEEQPHTQCLPCSPNGLTDKSDRKPCRQTPAEVTFSAFAST